MEEFKGAAGTRNVADFLRPSGLQGGMFRGVFFSGIFAEEAAQPLCPQAG